MGLRGGVGSGMGSKGDSQTVRISMVAPNVLSWSSPLLSMNEKQMTSLVRLLESVVQAGGGVISRSVLRLCTEQF